MTWRRVGLDMDFDFPMVHENPFLAKPMPELLKAGVWLRF
jgi:hypothetical protein